MAHECKCGGHGAGGGCCGGHGGEHGHHHGEQGGCGCGGHHHGEHGHHHGEQGGCGCGGHHHGEHGHHHHDHSEGEPCGCGCGGHVNHDHAQDDFDAPAKVVESRPATPEQRSFLQNFEKIAPLPIAKYLVKSSTEHSFENIALGDVCLRSANDSIALIKETAAFLQGLEASNLIAIDYETPMADDCYAHFYASDSYALFEQTVAEGGAQGFLGDIATIEKGSIVMTAHGKAQLAE